MKAIGYCWAEALDEGDETPRETVQQAIELYARRRRWAVRIQLEASEHAFTEFAQRPWGRELLEILRPGHILLVPDPSYLFRTPGQGRLLLEALRKKKVAVHSMDCGEDLLSDKGAPALISVLRAMEAFEAQLPSARMRSRKQQQKAEGRYLGGNPPFGFTVNGDGTLLPDDGKARVLKFMRRKRAQGKSLRAIARELAEKGIKISHSGVAAALKAANTLSERENQSASP